MNERNRIEQLFYCHRCNDIAQVCPLLHRFYSWIRMFTFTNPVSTVYGWNLFRKAVFSNIEFSLKSCVVLKFKNLNGGKGFDVIFVWRWVLVSKEISNATFAIQLMLQFYNTLDSSFESKVSIWFITYEAYQQTRWPYEFYPSDSVICRGTIFLELSHFIK